MSALSSGSVNTVRSREFITDFHTAHSSLGLEISGRIFHLVIYNVLSAIISTT